jgi:hypothetical protein
VPEVNFIPTTTCPFGTYFDVYAEPPEVLPKKVRLEGELLLLLPAPM